MKRAVFLDRDGVVNRSVVRDGKPYPPQTLAEFEFLPGVEDAMRSLRKAGFVVVVVTNQPDVSTGKQTRAVVESMHAMLLSQGLCDDVRVCYHTDADGCECRKPKPGMLRDASRDLGLDLGKSFMVGDRWRDVGAGKAAECFTYFIDYGYNERAPERPDAVVDSLAAAAREILKNAAQPIA